MKKATEIGGKYIILIMLYVFFCKDTSSLTYIFILSHDQ